MVKAMTEQISEEKDWGALAEKHLASIKRDMKISLEDATVRAAHKVMTEFNDTERESKVKQEAVRAAVNIKEELTKLIADSYDQGVKDGVEVTRNATIEEVAQHIEKLAGFGPDTISSFAIYIRRLKK
jgi:hypothetical protein